MNECPVCASDLRVEGNPIRSLGERSDSAIVFGQEVVSLECGHRLHRQCLVSWLRMAQSPTCPMCRNETEWLPSLQEERSITRLMNQSWKNLGHGEKNVLKIVWFICFLVSLTDPLIFSLVSSIICAILPPIFFPQVMILSAIIRRFISSAPGVNASMSFAFGSLFTVLVLTNHEMG